MSKKLFHPITIINAIGILISAYAHYVSVTKQAEPNYKPFCDISESMSCSRVLTSDYSDGFGFMGSIFGQSSFLHQKNSTIGMIAHVIFILLNFSDRLIICKLNLILSVLSIVSVIYLAVILVILRDICIVCVSSYIVLILNYVLIRKKIRALENKQTKKKVT